MRPGGRRSIRWRGFNYATPGSYYVTIVTQGRICRLASCAGGLLLPNPAGHLVEDWWLRIPTSFRQVVLDSYVVMPNHLHGILRFRRSAESGNGIREHPLGRVVGWFKAQTTADYCRRVEADGWPRIRKRLWQRNYYEHVIRDDDELAHARGYIARNPQRWAADPYNPHQSLEEDPQSPWDL